MKSFSYIFSTENAKKSLSCNRLCSFIALHPICNSIFFKPLLKFQYFSKIMESLYQWTPVPDDVHERMVQPMTQEEHHELFFSWYRPDLLGHVDLSSDSETD